MSALEGLETGLACRAMLAGAVTPRAVSESSARELLLMVSITDCKSVFNAVHRIGKAASEKRLMVDLC